MLLRRVAGKLARRVSACRSRRRSLRRNLMNLARHNLGFSKTANRFPTKGTCLSIDSRCINAEVPIEEVLGIFFPWGSSWATELKQLFAAYVEAKQGQNVLDYDDLLLYWAQMMSDPALADDVGAASTMFWSTNARIRTGCNRLSCWVSSRSHAQVTCQVPSQPRQRSNARRRQCA